MKGVTGDIIVRTEEDASIQGRTLMAGAELGGLLPTEIQNYTVFAGAIVANAKQPAAGKALLEFLAAPGTIKVMKAKGLEPAS